MPSRWYVRPFVHLTTSLAALLAVTAPAAAQAGQPAPARRDHATSTLPA